MNAILYITTLINAAIFLCITLKLAETNRSGAVMAALLTAGQFAAVLRLAGII